MKLQTVKFNNVVELTTPKLRFASTSARLGAQMGTQFGGNIVIDDIELKGSTVRLSFTGGSHVLSIPVTNVACYVAIDDVPDTEKA